MGRSAKIRHRRRRRIRLAAILFREQWDHYSSLIEAERHRDIKAGFGSWYGLDSP